MNETKDSEILALFLSRDERAVEEAMKAYGHYCHVIADRILSSDADAEECVNDAMLGAWNSIPPNEPQTLRLYFGKLARNAALHRLEARQAQKRGGDAALALDELAECLPDGAADAADTLALREAFNGFLGSLPEKAAKIFVMRYWYIASVGEIARENGMTENGVLTALSRTRGKLRRYLQKEGFTL